MHIMFTTTCIFSLPWTFETRTNERTKKATERMNKRVHSYIRHWQPPQPHRKLCVWVWYDKVAIEYHLRYHYFKGELHPSKHHTNIYWRWCTFAEKNSRNHWRNCGQNCDGRDILQSSCAIFSILFLSSAMKGQHIFAHFHSSSPFGRRAREIFMESENHCFEYLRYNTGAHSHTVLCVE